MESTGHDGISSEILKSCSPRVKKYSVKAFNIRLGEHKVPPCMKFAEVIPLIKKEDRNNPEDCLLISLLTSVSKFLKTVLEMHGTFFPKEQNVSTNEVSLQI